MDDGVAAIGDTAERAAIAQQARRVTRWSLAAATALTLAAVAVP